MRMEYELVWKDQNYLLYLNPCREIQILVGDPDIFQLPTTSIDDAPHQLRISCQKIGVTQGRG
jgi:hypothetical protein